MNIWLLDISKMMKDMFKPLFIKLSVAEGVYCSLDYESLLMGVTCNTYSEVATIYHVKSFEEMEFIEKLGYKIEVVCIG